MAFGTLALIAWTMSLRGQSAFSTKLGVLGRETQRDWASVLLFRTSGGLDDPGLYGPLIRTASILKNTSLEKTGEAAAPASPLQVKVVDLIPGPERPERGRRIRTANLLWLSRQPNSRRSWVASRRSLPTRFPNRGTPRCMFPRMEEALGH